MHAPANDTRSMQTTMTPLLLLSLLAGPGYAEYPCQTGSPLMLQSEGCRVGWQGEPVPYVPQAGDLILFRNSNVLNRAAFYVSLSGSTTHVALVVARPDGSLGLFETRPFAPVIMDDLTMRVTEGKGQVSVRQRKTPLTAEQSSRLTAFATAQLGKRFNFCGCLATPFSLPCRFFEKESDPDRQDRPRYFCSGLVLRACIAACILNGDKINPDGSCASDLADDLLLDLSCGWEKPRVFVKPCK
jgi:hypothetical protein